MVLDTHAWLWWCDDPRRLSSRARATVAAASQLGVGATSCFELAALAAHGRIDLATRTLPPGSPTRWRTR